LEEIASAAVTACRTAYPNDVEAIIRNAIFIFILAGLVRGDDDVVIDLDMVDNITRSFDELERFGRPITASLMSSLRRMTLDHPDGPDPLAQVFPTWKTVRGLVAHIHRDEPARLMFQTLYRNTISRLSIGVIMTHVMHQYPPNPTLPRRSLIPSILFPLATRIRDDDDDIEAARPPRLGALPMSTDDQVAAGLILAEILSEVDRD
jgi:hypothetical protein